MLQMGAGLGAVMGGGGGGDAPIGFRKGKGLIIMFLSM